MSSKKAAGGEELGEDLFGKGERLTPTEAIPTMIKGGCGAIVNIGSYAAVRGNHGSSYTAAKAGVIGLTKSIAFGYAKQGICCNVINPRGKLERILDSTREEFAIRPDRY